MKLLVSFAIGSPFSSFLGVIILSVVPFSSAFVAGIVPVIIIISRNVISSEPFQFIIMRRLCVERSDRF